MTLRPRTREDSDFSALSGDVRQHDRARSVILDTMKFSFIPPLVLTLGLTACASVGFSPAQESVYVVETSGGA